MNLTADNRTLITARQAAELLGLSMVRVRQLCRSGRLWSLSVSNRMRMLDAAEVRRFARAAAWRICSWLIFPDFLVDMPYRCR
jgi:hypothetical protein